jgi:hypothetical protein
MRLGFGDDADEEIMILMQSHDVAELTLKRHFS